MIREVEKWRRRSGKQLARENALVVTLCHYPRTVKAQNSLS